MRYIGIVLVMTAALFWGVSGGISNILLNKGYDALVISFYRGAIGFLFFLTWYLYHFKQKWITSTRFYLWSFLAGVGVAGNFTFYYLSIRAASISVAVTLMYTAPVFVLLTALLLGLERSTWFKWGSVSLVIAGIVILTGSYDISSVSTSFLGTIAGLASGLSYTLFIFSFKNAARIGNTKATLTVSFFAFSLILLIIMDTREAADALISEDLGWFLLLGILGAGLSFIFYVVGLRSTPPSIASMVAMVEPVTASLFGILVLGDMFTLTQFYGMVLILGTVTLLTVKTA